MSRPADPRPFPGAVWGDYPQRADGIATRGPQAWARWLRAASGGPGAAPYAQFAGRVQDRAQVLRALPEPERAARVQALRRAWAGGQPWDGAGLATAFALVALALESTQGMAPYPQQLMAARILLDNRLAEMATGEGKTVAIALAAAVAALGGTPVHVITANDYLALRDAQAMAPLYRALGLTVGAVTQPMAMAQRRRAWGCHIAYCTAKELVFDYLRDGLGRPAGLSTLEHRARRLAAQAREEAGAPMLLRGLCMAIVDEADTVLIDEASVPLVLSQPGAAVLEQGFLKEAARLAAALEQGVDFELLPASRQARLTDAGRARLQAWAPSRLAVHNDPRHREETLGLALTAQHLLQRDRDYVLRDGCVTLVDETTGRAAPGRAWSRGLHQLVEIKEGCAFTARNETVSQITYQRFFPRYLRLCGMSGTVGDAATEMAVVYGLATVRVPPRLPVRRETLPLLLYPDNDALWQAVAERARALQAQGRPVLIGTASVAQSQQLSAVLQAAGLAHAVLNARQDSAEGEVVAAAGQGGRITVATSMAGRGTDIALGEGVAQRGGLHVILCQHNASARIDRQFLGRAARQGQPGSVQTLLSLAFPLFDRWLPGVWLRAVRARGAGPVKGPTAWLTAHLPQWLASYTARRQRQTLRSADEETERELTFHRGTPL